MRSPRRRNVPITKNEYYAVFLQRRDSHRVTHPRGLEDEIRAAPTHLVRDHERVEPNQVDIWI